MSDIELGSVISLIMENPELIAEIKRLAEAKSNEAEETSASTAIKDSDKRAEVIAPVTECDRPAPEKHARAKGRRNELLHALSPYISEGRQKALETFMTIADILDMMREK